jgi:flagellar hook-basal body complex protein FliE
MAIEALAGAASEWTVPSITEADAVSGGDGGANFGGILGDQLRGLQDLQNDAAKASRSLADGTATDPSQVVVAVERAQLAMQLAAQLRTKSVDAISEVMRTQV